MQLVQTRTLYLSVSVLSIVELLLDHESHKRRCCQWKAVVNQRLATFFLRISLALTNNYNAT